MLDHVNKLDQLNALCGSHQWFGQGSKIIITTRDYDLLCRLQVDYVYRMGNMDDNEYLEIFSGMHSNQVLWMVLLTFLEILLSTLGDYR